MQICQILLKRGASPNGNTIYDMRPLHIAVRREWMQVTRVLLEAGRLNTVLSVFDETIFVFRSESEYSGKRYLCFSTNGYRRVE